VVVVHSGPALVGVGSGTLLGPEGSAVASGHGGFPLWVWRVVGTSWFLSSSELPGLWG
jgi:hypothetical protein